MLPAAPATAAALSVIFMHGLERLELSLTFRSVSLPLSLYLSLPLPTDTIVAKVIQAASVGGTTPRPESDLHALIPCLFAVARGVLSTEP